MLKHFSKKSYIDSSQVNCHPKQIIIEGFLTIPNYDYVLIPLIKENEDIKTHDSHFFCFKCKKWMKISNTFGNIKAHLKNVHHEFNEIGNKGLTELQKAVIARKMILLNGLPFSIAESPEMKALSPLVGSRKSISIQCSFIAEEVRRLIKRKFTNSQEGHWIVVDEWTDKGNQRYLGIHAFILDNSFELEHIFLAHQTLSAIHCDAPYIACIIKEISSNMLINSPILGLVTDTTNLMPAVADILKVKWGRCYCHVMNLLVQDFLEACNNKLEYLFQIQRTLGSSVVFHNYLVSQKSTITSLPSITSTRWYSIFKLMMNFVILQPHIQAYLTNNHNYSIGIPPTEYFKTITYLMEVFGTAKNVMKTMESDDFGSLSYVIDSFRLLYLSVQRLPDDFLIEKNKFGEAFSIRWIDIFKGEEKKHFK